MINHHISDLIARINNARLRNSTKLSVVYTKDNLRIITKLEKEGCVNNINTNLEDKIINFSLNNNSFVKIQVISTPGRRIYRGWKNIHESYSYQTLIRTSKGVKTSSEAINEKLGGEILLKIK